MNYTPISVKLNSTFGNSATKSIHTAQKSAMLTPGRTRITQLQEKLSSLPVRAQEKEARFVSLSTHPLHYHSYTPASLSNPYLAKAWLYQLTISKFLLPLQSYSIFQ